MSNLLLGNVRTSIVNVLDLTTAEYNDKKQAGSSDEQLLKKYFLEKRLIVEFETVPFAVVDKIDPHPLINGNITIEYFLSDGLPNIPVNHVKNNYGIHLDNAVLTHTTTVLVFETQNSSYAEGGFYTCSNEEKDVILVTKDKL